MSNLVISGGVTLSGGFEAGFGGGGISIAANSLEINPTTFLNVVWTYNEATYSVSNGVLTMNYRLATNAGTSVNHLNNTFGYRVVLPAGYAFAGSVTDGQIVGTGTIDFKDGSGARALNMEAYSYFPLYGGAPEGIAPKLITENSYLRSGLIYTFNKSGNGFDLQFTYSIPVVTV